MYILKVKGKSSTPDYIQIRDEHYTLVAYFSANNAERSLKMFGFNDVDLMLKTISNIPFSKIQKL